MKRKPTYIHLNASAVGFPHREKHIANKPIIFTSLIGKKKKKTMKKPGLHYMKSTASADARREEQSKVSRRQSPQTSLNSSSLHLKGSANSPSICLNTSKDATESLGLKMSTTSKKKSLKIERETCSSTLKGSKFPDYLKPGSGGAESGVKVCSYSCCSVNGHHRPLLPPIKSFVSARRLATRTERSLKLRPEARPTLSSPNGEGDFMIKFDEISVDEVPQLQETFDEKSLSDLLFEGTQTPNTTNATDEEATAEMGKQAPYLCAEEMTAGVYTIKYDQVLNQTSSDENTNTIDNDNLRDHVENECNEENQRGMEKIPETEEKSSRPSAVEREDRDEPGLISPRGLHFLAAEADPEAENVKLRHQQLDARKNAEEWMVDYALREAVTRMSPARQRKVALLVEAFERVLPPSKS